jgi:hypothetical protein
MQASISDLITPSLVMVSFIRLAQQLDVAMAVGAYKRELFQFQRRIVETWAAKPCLTALCTTHEESTTILAHIAHLQGC